MKYAGAGVRFTDGLMREEAVASIIYGFGCSTTIVIFLLRRGPPREAFDIEARVRAVQARTLLEALRTAINWAPPEGSFEMREAPPIACEDLDTRDEGRVTLRYDGALVALGLDVKSIDPTAREVTMGREEAAALFYMLEAALKWVDRYRRPEREEGACNATGRYQANHVA